MALRRRNRDERGAAAVEFALILPIFLILLFGIIDFGYMINRSSIINNAARDGVREASLKQPEATVRQAAQHTLNGVPNATVQVSCRLVAGGTSAFSTCQSPNSAVVTVRYQHEMLTPIGMFFPGGFDLTRTAEMRIEQ